MSWNKRADPHLQRVDVDRARGLFRQLAHHLAVVVGPRRLDRHPLQKRVIEVRQFEQREVAGDADQRLHQGQDEEREGDGEHGRERRRQVLGADLKHGQPL